MTVSTAILGTSRNLTRTSNPKLITHANTCRADTVTTAATGMMELLNLFWLQSQEHTLVTNISRSKAFGPTAWLAAVFTSPTISTVTLQSRAFLVRKTRNRLRLVVAAFTLLFFGGTVVGTVGD